MDASYKKKVELEKARSNQLQKDKAKIQRVTSVLCALANLCNYNPGYIYRIQPMSITKTQSRYHYQHIVTSFSTISRPSSFLNLRSCALLQGLGGGKPPPDSAAREVRRAGDRGVRGPPQEREHATGQHRCQQTHKRERVQSTGACIPSTSRAHAYMFRRPISTRCP